MNMNQLRNHPYLVSSIFGCSIGLFARVIISSHWYSQKITDLRLVQTLQGKDNCLPWSQKMTDLELVKNLRGKNNTSSLSNTNLNILEAREWAVIHGIKALKNKIAPLTIIGSIGAWMYSKIK